MCLRVRPPPPKVCANSRLTVYAASPKDVALTLAPGIRAFAVRTARSEKPPNCINVVILHDIAESGGMYWSLGKFLAGGVERVISPSRTRLSALIRVCRTVGRARRQIQGEASHDVLVVSPLLI